MDAVSSFNGGVPADYVIEPRAVSVAAAPRPSGGLRFDRAAAGKRFSVWHGVHVLPRLPVDRPPSPMDTRSPLHTPVGSPMDTSSPPHSPVGLPMDTSAGPAPRSTSPLPASAIEPDRTRAGHSAVRQIALSSPASNGMHRNGIGMLEKNTFSKVYRAASVNDRDAIQQLGFLPSNHFGGIDRMIEGNALIVSETADGARVFGDSECGPGCYDLYEIDARGCKGASLQDNVDHNTRFVAQRLGYTPEALKSMPPREVAEGALEFREAHVDAAAGERRRVRLIESGVLPAHGPSSEASAASEREAR